MSEKKSFLEVTKEWMTVSNGLELLAAECGGEDNSRLEEEIAKFAAIQELHGYKIDAVGAVKSRLRALSAEINGRSVDLKKFADTLAKAADHLEYKIKMAMEIMGQDELCGFETRFKLVKNPGRLVIRDETQIPSAYKRVVETVEIDKAQIKKDLQDGAPVDGCEIETGYSLRTYANTSAGLMKASGK